MTRDEVFALLEEQKDERGIRNFDERAAGGSGLTTFGLGLTKLRKLAKAVGRDRDLARELWATSCYDARIIALLIDDPRAITRDQAEEQVEQLAGGHLAHVFSSCDATLSKTAFVAELARDWTRSEDVVRRCCGYGLVYEVSKSRKKSAPEDGWFQDHVDHISKRFSSEDPDVQLSMGSALMGIGKRNRSLNASALAVARACGPIDFDPEGSCEPFDVVKHLTSPSLRKKLGIA